MENKSYAAQNSLFLFAVSMLLSQNTEILFMYWSESSTFLVKWIVIRVLFLFAIYNGIFSFVRSFKKSGFYEYMAFILSVMAIIIGIAGYFRYASLCPDISLDWMFVRSFSLFLFILVISFLWTFPKQDQAFKHNVSPKLLALFIIGWFSYLTFHYDWFICNINFGTGGVF